MTGTGRTPLSVVVLTFNEERNIRTCLESVSGLADEIMLVDSGSTDGTIEIAREFTDKVYHHEFESFTKQWRWALDELPIAGEWVLGLDADQRLTPGLVSEIEGLLGSGADGFDGFYIKRRQVFMGRWIKYGTYYPRYMLKLFRLSKVALDTTELQDHHFYVPGRTARLDHDIIEENLNEDLFFWTAKHNRYSSAQASEEFRRGYELRGVSSLFGDQDERRLGLLGLWHTLPLFVRSMMYFSYRYFLRLGFLDGKEGLIFHFLQAFWYRFLVDAKILEMRKGDKSAPGP